MAPSEDINIVVWAEDPEENSAGVHAVETEALSHSNHDMIIFKALAFS